VVFLGNTDELTTDSELSTEPNSPFFPTVDLSSPASMGSIVSTEAEEKTVSEGIELAKAEMSGFCKF